MGKMVLTPDVRKKIVAAIKSGATMADAARSCGIAPKTLEVARARGRAGNETFEDFYHEIEDARATSRIAAIQYILADESWQSKAWFLERSDPKNWGRRTYQEVSDKRKPAEATDEEVRREALKQLSKDYGVDLVGIVEAAQKGHH